MEQRTPGVVTDRGTGHSTDPDRGGEVRPGGRVVVGVDGSDGARAALAWALREAARRGSDLEVLTAFAVDFYWTDAYLLDERRLETMRERAAARSRQAVDEALRDPEVAGAPGAGSVPVHVVVADGAAAEQLVARGRPGDLLVVGSRGHGAVHGALLGSVALRSVMHAHCPVVVVPPGYRPRAARLVPTVVVGLDGSAAARAALGEAAREARRSGGRVEVVVALEPLGPWVDLTTIAVPTEEARREAVAARTRATVEEVVGASGDPARPPVDVVLVEGPPAAVLTRRAHDADLLVVGSRGAATLPGLVLGSVALRCVVHAPCPVMVVHAAPAGDRAEPAGREVPEVGGVPAPA